MSEKLADASDSAVSTPHSSSAEHSNATQTVVSFDRVTAASSPRAAMNDSMRAATMTGAQATVGTARLNRLMNPPVGDSRRSASLQPADTLPIGAAEATRAPTGGQPLDTNVRGPAERAVGADLGGVRVHTGPEANAAAESLSARAFTTGKDIFLGPGESPTDTRLIAHEAAHVVQNPTEPRVRLYTPTGGDERETVARRAEDAAVSARGQAPRDAAANMSRQNMRQQSASPVADAGLAGQSGASSAGSASTRSGAPAVAAVTAPPAAGPAAMTAPPAAMAATPASGPAAMTAPPAGMSAPPAAGPTATTETAPESASQQGVSSSEHPLPAARSTSAPAAAVAPAAAPRAAGPETGTPGASPAVPTEQALAPEPTDLPAQPLASPNPAQARQRGSVGLRATADVADDSIGTESHNAGTQLLLRQLRESAAAGRKEFADRLATAIDGIDGKVEGYETALAHAGEQQNQAVTAAFSAARRRIAARFASARAAVVRGGQAQRVALGAWQTRTCSDVGRLFGTKQARVIQIGEAVAGRATTAGERAANDARVRIRNKAEEARQIGAAKARVGSRDADASKAKAKVATDLAADTASNVMRGVEDVGSGLTASGPEVAAKFREQAAQASRQLRLAEPQVVGQVGRIRADAARAITHTVSTAISSLTAQEHHLLAQMARQEARSHARVRSAVAAKQAELRRAGEHVHDALVQQGKRVLESTRKGTRELASRVATQSIAPDEAATAAGQMHGGLRSAFADVGEKADAAVAKVQVALDAGGSDAVAAISRVGSAVERDVTDHVPQIDAKVREHKTASISALTRISQSTAKAATDLLGEMGAGLDQNVGEVDRGFNKGLADYEQSLREKVSEKESKAVEPVSTLGARIDTAQARVEAEAGHSWLGNQLRSLGRMLTDPGFWVGLVVGLILTIVVIVLLPEELTALVIVAAIAAFGAVGAIGAGVGTIVDNVVAGRSWHEGLGQAMVIGFIFGAVLGVVGLAFGASAATLAGVATLSVVAGVLTVITNVATGRPWDENLLANMLLVGLFARFGPRLAAKLRGPGRPPIPPRPVVDPNAPPVVDPNAPPVVDPNAPPAVDPNPPPAVDPNPPPAPYDPTTRTIAELRGDLDQTPRPGETPAQAAERARRAQIELDHREVLDRLNALPERPPHVDMAANDAANRPNGAHTSLRHNPDFPMERSLDAAGHPDGTQTVEGRVYGDPPWDVEGGQQNKSFHWRTWDLLNETVNRYLRAHWAQIREDLALLGSHDATADAGKPVGDGYFNRRAYQPGAHDNPVPQRINNVSRFTIRIRFNPGGHPPFFILTTFPDPPLFI